MLSARLPAIVTNQRNAHWDPIFTSRIDIGMSCDAAADPDDKEARAPWHSFVGAKARMYDLAYEPAAAATMRFAEGGEHFSTLLRPPIETEHWHEKWRAVDLYLNDIRGVVTRVGDKTVGKSASPLAPPL